MRLMTTLMPTVERFGFALFLTLNATSVWGGIFPFLPDSTRTSDSTIAFFALQLAAYSLTFFAFMTSSYRRPSATRSISVLPGSCALAASGVMLVAAMYIEWASLMLIVASAVLLGVGSAWFIIGWQKVFASQDGAESGQSIIVAAGYSAVLYLIICLIPVALTAYLLPLVMVPLAGLCLWIAAQRVDFDQAMFEDCPTDHPAIYRNVMRESLAAAISIGALGFCAGAVRFILITHQSISSVVNIASMGVLLAVVMEYLALWRSRTLRFDVMNFYRVIFPIMAVGLVLMPFMGENVSTVGAAISYACFSLATIVMMMHCCQISRDSGINPVFIYALFGAVVYLIQVAGYFVGYLSGSESALGMGQLSFVAIASLFVLLVASLAAGQSRPLHTTRLEFLAPSLKRLQAASAPRIVTVEAIEVRDATAQEQGAAKEEQGSAKAPQRSEAEEGIGSASSYEDSDAAHPYKSPVATHLHGDVGANAPHENVASANASHEGAGATRQRKSPSHHGASSNQVIDRLSKQCLSVAEEYGLSSRETEVMELLGRGRTGPAIADELFISENTVRTHIKRIYAKVGVGKKQELLAVLDHAMPS